MHTQLRIVKRIVNVIIIIIGFSAIPAFRQTWTTSMPLFIKSSISLNFITVSSALYLFPILTPFCLLYSITKRGSTLGGQVRVIEGCFIRWDRILSDTLLPSSDHRKR
jgi:hypothetical protein